MYTLEELTLDPVRAMGVFVAKFSDEKDKTLVDPSNPFVMSLEATVVTGSNTLASTVVLNRRAHPSLAVTNADILQHLVNDELPGIFATPGMAVIRFMINAMDMRKGHTNPLTGGLEVTLPKYTTVSVSNATLTLLSDIKIVLLNNISFVEQLSTDDFVSLSGLGNLESKVITDNTGIKWITFDTVVKQVVVESHDFIALESVKLNKRFPLVDQYYYSELLMKNADTGGEWVEVNKTHSDIVFNPEVPTVSLRYDGEALNLEVPGLYLTKGVIKGELSFKIYTTKGDLHVPLNKFDAKDFKIKLPVLSKPDPTKLSLGQIHIGAKGETVLDGGTDSKGFEYLKRKVIEHSTGLLDIPITKYEIEERGRLLGFEVDKVLDIVLDRVYVAAKPVTASLSESLPTNIDGFTNIVRLVISDIENSKQIKITSNTMVIKSNTLFEDVAGVFKPLSLTETFAVATCATVDKRDLYLSRKLYFNPFTYVLDENGVTLGARIYDLDAPVLENLVIRNKNLGTGFSVNIDKFKITKVSNGYEIHFSVVSNKSPNSSSVNHENLFIQVSLAVGMSSERMYYHCKVDPSTNIGMIFIETDFYVDVNDNLRVKNALTSLYEVSTNIKGVLDLIIYTTDTIATSTVYAVTNKIKFSGQPQVTALREETIDVCFGVNLDFLWNRVSLGYTSNKYRTHSIDVPMFYDKDVIGLDEAGSPLVFLDNDNDGVFDDYEFNILHHAGDPVLNSLGETVYKHKKGDILLGDDGKPLLDLERGLVRFVDILMFQAEYLATNLETTNDVVASCIDTIRKWVLVDGKVLNKNLLENSKVFIRPPGSSGKVSLKTQATVRSWENFVKPTVVIYENGNSILSRFGMETIVSIVGKVMEKHFKKKVTVIKDVKDDIILALGDTVRGVKITNLLEENEVFEVADITNRLYIGKVIDADLDVVYDLELTVTQV